MAGLYSKFKKGGYDTPKYLLKDGSDNTILNIVLENILKYYHFDNVLLVANMRDENFRQEIYCILRNFNENELEIIGFRRVHAV